MPQERWNTEWVRSQGLGVVLRRFSDVAQGVQQVLQHLPALRAQVQAVHNRAVFEVPDVLQRLLQGLPQPVSTGMTAAMTAAMTANTSAAMTADRRTAQPTPSPA
jgi:hypothetical protein